MTESEGRFTERKDAKPTWKLRRKQTAFEGLQRTEPESTGLKKNKSQKDFSSVKNPSLSVMQK